MSAKRLIDGVNVTLSGRVFVAPPIPLGCMRKHGTLFNGQALDVSDMDTVMAMADVILMTLQRNYPELTQDDLDELLDPVNMPMAFAAIGEASGMQSTKPGEAGSGEL